ncbi:MAG: TrkA family potassium uptake protein [Candidatus Omnitrophica bacterium]|nr:TrkA family potassium uptake protein [Candidatus Omnitrophota bacterium]MCM8792848.1 TrkA family potassium uptake protein [Candidatus Omnitrophota bacterium]
MYIIIVGCGRVGAELARILQDGGHNVVVVDKNPDAFKRLGNTFNGVTLVGNGFDLDTLKEAGIEKADALCAVTNGDNTNIMSAQVARKIFNVPKVIARIYDPQRAEIYRSLGINTLSGTVLFASLIRDKLIESQFSSYLIETKELGVLEFRAPEEIVGKLIKEVNLPGELLVVTVVKKKTGTVIPTEQTMVEKGDILIAVVKISALKKVKTLYKIG